EKRKDVEVLLDERDVLLRIQPELDEGCLLLELVAQNPDAELLALHLLERVDAAALPRHLGRAAAGEDLRDVDEVVARVALGEQAREPVDAELGAPAEHNLLGADVRAAELHVDVETRLFVIPLRLGCEVAGE